MSDSSENKTEIYNEYIKEVNQIKEIEETQPQKQPQSQPEPQQEPQQEPQTQPQQEPQPQKVYITKLEYSNNLEIIGEKFTKYTKDRIEIFDNLPLLLEKLPLETVFDKIVMYTVFWNLETNKLFTIEDKDHETRIQLYVYEKLKKQLETFLENFSPEQRAMLLKVAREQYDSKRKKKSVPLSKEEQKKVDDSFLPPEFRNTNSKQNTNNENKKNKKKRGKKKKH